MRPGAGATHLLLAALLVLAGCGARTPLDPGGDASPPIEPDAGRPRDAGPPPDAGLPDCNVRSSLDPMLAFEDEEGAGLSYHAPRIAARAGGLDLMATLSVGGRPAEPALLRARVEGDALRFGARIPLDPVFEADAPVMAALGDRLGVCANASFMGAGFLFRELMGEGYAPTGAEVAVPDATCRAMSAGLGGYFLLGHLGPIVGYAVIRDGGLVGDRLVDEAEDALLGATAIEGAYVGVAQLQLPDDQRLIVGFLEPDVGLTEYHELEGFLPFPWSAPVVAPAGVGREGGVFVAGYSRSNDLTVVEVDRARGELRRWTLGFSMHADITPALVPLPGGMVVATLNYGDFDPTSGELEVWVIDRAGEVRGPLAYAAQRQDLVLGGIAGAALGDRAYLHYTFTDRSGSVARSQTRILEVHCGD